ncbi:bifunctional P-450:NADPH-P450 reductase [Biscogniauxia mediterranea]|nr:bifunctional P-450:NADPH-P450 reductase [Biscogniauxia mediterranea]
MASRETGITPVPGPRGIPFLGNITDVDPENSLMSFKRLADTYGEIFRLRFPRLKMVVVTTHALVDEICDEKRFKKIPTTVLQEIRAGVHDGLFTAFLEEPNWGIAHRVLMPAFGPVGIRGMFDEMHDIASQLVLKWARQGPHVRIHAAEDFTRMALDTIALCSMGFRFNNFYSEKIHPFVEAMGDFLTECGRRPQRLPFASFLYRSQDRKFEADIQVLRETAQAVLDERKSQENSQRKDLLTAMLKGRDSLTGQQMSDESIIDNLITFLIAGHETTSGTLSYAMHELLKHPEAYRKVQQEVDEVIGKGPVTVQHISKLPYIAAVLRETLRLDSPISIFSVTALEDTLLAGKYPVTKDESILAFLAKSHLDPAVFDDPLEFRPERMLDENFNKLPKNAWKPFGNGLRGCIGRPFAWQESVLALALLFQNFNFVLDDPNYVLTHHQTLTIKPKDFYIRAILRDDLNPTQLSQRLSGVAPPEATEVKKNPNGDAKPQTNGSADQQPSLTILYGSNSGTCESLAHRLAIGAESHGYQVAHIDCLDAYQERLPRGQPVVIVTTSYEGQPTDNAGHFVSWLENIKTGALEGVQYAVFGCGHHDWPQTFHRIPKLVDRKLAEAGATRLADMGLADVASEDVIVAFETWEDNVFWPALRSSDGDGSSPAAALQARISNPRASMLHLHVQPARVVAARTLTAPGEPVKKHLDVALPPGVTYRAGDYLAVLPINPRETVQRALRRFGLPWDASITIEGSGTLLPAQTPLPVSTVLGELVELAQPATKRNALALAEAAAGDDQKEAREALARLAGAEYEAEVLAKRVSPLDLLERYPSIDVPLVDFLAMLPLMRVRQYSISSSPLEHESVASITFSALHSPARWSGQGGPHLGVASTYLSGLQAGDALQVSVRASHASFHLPASTSPSSPPLIFVAAGTGIAPFRGFIRERMRQQGQKLRGKQLAPAVLYHGCREPGADDLYADEAAAEWEPVVAVRRAYSRAPERSGGCRYVQDLLWADRARVADLWWRGGAMLYICGSRQISQEVEKVFVRMKREMDEAEGRQPLGEAEAKAWWEKLRNVRYAVDVFD